MLRAPFPGIVAGFIVLSACTVGPDYVRPDAPVPVQYKEAGWKVGEPLDAIDRGTWWSVYKDPLLDDLEKQIDISNQNLKAAAAAFEQAEWIVAQFRAGFFPIFDLNASAQRSRTGGGSSSSTGVGRSGFNASAFSTSVSASWVPDLWGKIRRTVEGDVASAQASAGNLASARLSAQGALASDYLQLRMSDELTRLLDADHWQSVSSRHHGPVSGRAGRGATRVNASAGDRGRRDARSARARHRGSDRQATRRILDTPDGSEDRGAGDTARNAVGAFGAPAGHRRV